MNMRRRTAWLGSFGVVAVALLTLILAGGCQHRAAQKEEAPAAQSKPAAAAITVENGQTFITLDAATQKRLGFTVATLTSSSTRAQAAFPAVVVSVQELATFRTSYVAAQTQLQKARIEAGVAGKEYARLKALAGPEQNVSEKSLQAAEAALQSDEADVHAAEQQLNLQADVLRQEWGGVVTEWATQSSTQAQPVRSPA